MKSSSRDLRATSGGLTGSDIPSTPDLSVAEWAVIRSNYTAATAVGPISKQTAQRIYHPSKWGGTQECFTDLGAVLFRGPQQVCQRLAEQIVSSKALAEQERRAAYGRHEDRTSRLIGVAAKTGGDPSSTPDAELGPGRNT